MKKIMRTGGSEVKKTIVRKKTTNQIHLSCRGKNGSPVFTEID